MAFSGVEESSAPKIWERLDELMPEIASANEPYWLGTQVFVSLVDAITGSVTASRVYQLCADLTDRYELRPQERGETEAVMRQAASEWLAIKEDRAARERYLHRWLSQRE